MITHIDIRDFVLIESLDIELGPGMTALTGETGAGKSILVDAIGLVLGDRADTGAIRHGADRAEIAVTIDTGDCPAAREWLMEQELEEDGECLLRRTLGADGKSRAFINGRPATIQTLRDLGERLVDIHGQHVHQSLARREVQRGLLDNQARHEILLDEMAVRHTRLSEVVRRLESLSGNAEARAARLELLRFQVRELQALDPRDGEYRELDEEQTRLAHAGRLLETAGAAYEGLYGAEDEALASRLARIVQSVTSVGAHDAALGPFAELLDSARIQIEEAAEGLHRYAERIELDPERLSQVEERLGLFHEIARKHRVPAETLHTLHQELEAELSGLEDSSWDREALEREIAETRLACLDTARRLNASRRKAAVRLGKSVTEAMQTLGMEGGRFEIAVEPDEDDLHAWGFDRVEFRVAANPGQPPETLARVASGGELSRISLAIQIIAAGGTGIPTLIFDEVDAGIGGGVAEVVGRHLRTLGEHRQVLCVTHLPQVAAQAHHHLQVSKTKGQDTTATRIEILTGEERIGEISRMLGGVEITARTRSHAREMLATGKGRER